MTRIRLPYVKEYRDQTGRVRRYFRRKGYKNAPLQGAPGSTEFMDAYRDAMGENAEPKQRAAGTFGKLVTDYYQSVAFTKLKASSRKHYRFALEPLAAKHGHRTVRGMQREHVEKILGEIGTTRPGMANLTRSVLHKLMAFAVKTKWRADNPIAGIESYKGGTRHTWTDDELTAYEKRWPFGTLERLAYTLLIETGQRVGDVTRMQRTDISAGRIHVVQEKTGAELWIPITATLSAALKAGPTHVRFLLANRQGRQMDRYAVFSLIKRAAKDAGLPARCSPHGLRKALMRRLAEAGKSSKEIAAVSGHQTLKEVENYTRAASQTKLADSALSNPSAAVSKRSKKPRK